MGADSMAENGNADAEKEGEALISEKQDADLVSAHTWKPIKRSFLRSSPLENSGVYLLSELPMPVLHMEYDWAVKKKNVRLFIWVLMSLVLIIVELELAFDVNESRYTMQTRCEALKAVNTFMTTMLLYYLYDYYDYQVAGAKKEWYKLLYDGQNPGPMPSFWQYFGTFLLEFLILAFHTPCYADFRFWTDVSGAQKPFVSDKLNSLCLLRLYTIIRVVRDYTPIYARRRLVYDGGYRERGAAEITYKLAMKANITLHEGTTTACLYFGSLFVLAYIYHVGERDWQPETYTYVNCIWLTAFQFAAMDFNAMSPISEFGTFVSVMIVVWGLIILSMLVNVIFNGVMLTSFEGWAIDWVGTYELCEEERKCAAATLAHWWNRKIEIQKRGAKADDGGSEATYIIKLVQLFKKMRDVSFMVNRNNPHANADEMTELQVGMKKDLRDLAEKMLGQEDAQIADDEEKEGAEAAPAATVLLDGDGSVYERSSLLAARVTQMEQTQEAVLRRVEAIYEAQKGAPPPPAE